MNIIFFIYNNIFVIFILLFSILYFFLIYLSCHFFFKGYEFDFLLNDYCQKNFNLMNDLEKLSCDNKYKKSKFIWLTIDGLPHDILNKLKNIDKYKFLNFFTVKTKQVFVTGPMYESKITGHYSNNLKYLTVKRDNILSQMNNFSTKIDFKGLDIPFGRFFKKRKVFDNIIFYKKYEPYSTQQFCDINVNVLDKEIDNYINNLSDQFGKLNNYLKDRNKIYKYLDNYFKNKIKSNFDECFKYYDFIKENKSFLFYSDNIDHENHRYFKYHINNLKNVYAMETFVVEFIKWIDDNPEFAFILTSDHGGEKNTYEDCFYNHGEIIENNYPFFLIYTKELKEKYDEWKEGIKITDLYNIAPTIAQIIKGINIPLESTGFPEFLGKDEILRIAAIKSKEFQLKNFINIYQKKYNEKIFNNLLDKLNNNKYNKLNNIKDFDEKISKEYINYLKDIQNDIIRLLKTEEEKNFFIYYQKILLYIIIIKLIIDCILLIKENLNKEIDRFEKYFKFLICFIICLIILFKFIYIDEDLYMINIIPKCMILIIIAIFSIIYFKYNNSLFKKQILMISLLFILPIFFIFAYHKKLLENLNNFIFNHLEYLSYFDLLITFSSFFLVKFILLKPAKNYYILKDMKYNLYTFLNILNYLFHILYFIFQIFRIDFNLKIENEKFFLSIKNIYHILIILLLILSFKSFYFETNNDKNIELKEKLIEKTKKGEKLLFLFKIIYYYYFLFVLNIYEKIYINFFLFLLLEFFTSNFKLYNKYYKIIIKFIIYVLINLAFVSSFNYRTILINSFKNYSEKNLFNFDLFKIFHYARYCLLNFVYIINLSKFSKKKFFSKSTVIIIKIFTIYIDSNFIFYILKINKIGVENIYSSDLFNWFLIDNFNFIIYNLFFIFFKLFQENIIEKEKNN